MTIRLTQDLLATVNDLQSRGQRVFVHLDIYGRAIRVDSFPPGNWIAPSYEIHRDGSLRRC